jgi:DNA-directed RNA polymerase subunit H
MKENLVRPIHTKMKGKFDIKKHTLVPKHKKLTEQEKKQVLEHFRITENELPKIMIDDTAIADQKCRTGDLIKITRNSATAGESFYYRVVING